MGGLVHPDGDEPAHSNQRLGALAMQELEHFASLHGLRIEPVFEVASKLDDEYVAQLLRRAAKLGTQLLTTTADRLALSPANLDLLHSLELRVYGVEAGAYYATHTISFAIEMARGRAMRKADGCWRHWKQPVSAAKKAAAAAAARPR